jgi:hypothetical protein
VSDSLLVNFVYAQQVGHVIEALHYTHGYHVADPSRRISLALNARTATELAALAPFAEQVHPIEVDLFDAGASPDLGGLPSTWDWIVTDSRSVDPAQREMFPGLAAYNDAVGERLEARQGRGLTGFKLPPSYAPGEHLRLTLPDEHRERAAARFTGGGPRIAILPGGSAPRSYYPSLRSWELIVAALLRRYPDATFCLVGKVREDDRTSTTFTRAELDRLLAAMPRSVDVVDAPLLDQVGAVGACDVLVSPHSGFSMIGLAFGTPWLTIGGGRWSEYFFNGVPFYSVIPDLDRFPGHTLMGELPADVEDDGPRTPSMSRARIEEDLDEIVSGTARLVERTWDYETALRDHATRMLPTVGGKPEYLWSIDNVLAKALTA